MLFQGVSEEYPLLNFNMIFIAFNIGWFIITLPTMFLYLYKRHIVNIFFHLGVMGLTYFAYILFYLEAKITRWVELTLECTLYSFLQIIPHLLFCIYATICNYGYFQSLDIKEKFILACKSFFAGLTLAIIWICIISLLTFYFDDVAISNKLVTLETALAILTNISLLAYIIYKDIKIYLAKKKER